VIEEQARQKFGMLEGSSLNESSSCQPKIIFPGVPPPRPPRTAGSTTKKSIWQDTDASMVTDEDQGLERSLMKTRETAQDGPDVWRKHVALALQDQLEARSLRSQVEDDKLRQAVQAAEARRAPPQVQALMKRCSELERSQSHLQEQNAHLQQAKQQLLFENSRLKQELASREDELIALSPGERQTRDAEDGRASCSALVEELQQDVQRLEQEKLEVRFRSE
jgi:hypothetical protein